MPFISVKQLAGRTEEQRAEIARELTETYARVTGVKPENIWVAIEEVPTENWAIAGVTFAEKARRAQG
ncbi:4-oxalocrotonate tautomerase family protein [Kitasatospora sp. GP82]|uniref:tautomerase family protein n=1 Tax=Kitasatospora sp. GP82 TaxID=3035089 RepID=UPI00247370E0|nr:4-oxalocrotonate tautomerase family protein [Kitasatospora sp. GP82]MDH6128990.1 4-oxalocrotonate tautomerase [Kitasatospora sp. GP82]